MVNATATLTEILLADLVDHPDNPRLSYRQDVIDGIAANLNGSPYPAKHAIHVRPRDGKYETLAGHHRRRAAEKAGHTTIQAWVEELDDDAAFMELALSNNQGELDPLEIGTHVFRAVPKATAGRGKKGGLSEYARKIGKDRGYVTELWQAGAVLQATKSVAQATDFLGRAKHLAAIHKLPPASWPAAVEYLQHHPALSAKDTAAQVAVAVEWLKEPATSTHAPGYIVPHEVAAAIFAKTLTPAAVARIVDLADRIAEYLQAEESLYGEWCGWLATDRPLDIKAVQDARIQFEDRLAKLTESPPTKEVQLLLADPPWQYDFAETSNRQIENQYPTATAEEIGEHLFNKDIFPHSLAENCVLFLWATAPKLREAIAVMDAWGFEYKTHAVWDKERMGMGYWFRGQHELLLVGTRGDFSPPERDKRVSSVFREKRAQKHSKKPACVYEALEASFPDVMKCEIYQRETRHGWLGCGNEAT